MRFGLASARPGPPRTRLRVAQTRFRPPRMKPDLARTRFGAPQMKPDLARTKPGPSRTKPGPARTKPGLAETKFRPTRTKLGGRRTKSGRSWAGERRPAAGGTACAANSPSSGIWFDRTREYSAARASPGQDSAGEPAVQGLGAARARRQAFRQLPCQANRGTRRRDSPRGRSGRPSAQEGRHPD